MKTNQPFYSFLKASRFYFLFFLLISSSFTVNASDYYWIGNGGNWSDLSHWATTSGGTTLQTQLPGAADDVFFDGNSFSLAAQTVQLDQPSCIAHDISWTAVLNTPALAGAYPATLRIFGSLTLTSPVNMTFLGIIYFSSTNAGETITSTGNTFSAGIDFDGIGGEWTLQDAYNSSRGIGLIAGTFNTNNKAITCSGFGSNSSTNVIRTLNLGSSEITLTGTYSWNVEGDGITVNGGTSVINLIAPGAHFSHYVNMPVSSYHDVNFTSTSVTQAGISASNAIIHNVDFAGNAGLSGGNYQNVVFHDNGSIPYLTVVDDITLTAGKYYSITSGLTVNGSLHADGTCDAFIEINLGAPGSQAYGAIVSTGNINVSHVRMGYMKGLGGGSFTATDSYNYPGNQGWNFVSTSQNKYWVGNGGNWSDGNHWSLTSGGPPAGCPPFANDNVFFDQNSFSMPGQIVVTDVAQIYFTNMDWANVTNTPSFNLSDTCDMWVYGSLSFNTAMTSNINGDVRFQSPSTGNSIRTGGQVFRGRINFWTQGEWTLLDSLTSESTIALDAGTFNSNDQTINATEFWIFGQTLNMGSSVFNLSGGMPVAAFTGATINPGTSVINCTGDTASLDNLGAPGQMLTPHTYYDVNFTGTLGAISGPDSFHNVVYYHNGMIWDPCDFHKTSFYGDGYTKRTNSYDSLYYNAGHTYTLGEGAAQVIRDHWQVQGTCTDSIRLLCEVPGSYAFFIQQTDSVIGAYLTMKYIQGTGGAVFKAYNSNDQGFNIGWNFTSLPPMGNPGSISGPATVCYGAANVSFHISPVTGALSYQWTVPPGASIVSGQGDTLIVVDFGTASSGSINVQASDGCAFSTNNSSLVMTIEPVPAPVVTLIANPATTICPRTPITFTATATNSGTGTLTYDFKLNGSTVQDGPSNTWLSTTLSNGDMITCTLTVSGGSCYTTTSVLSNTITMTVDPGAVNVYVQAGQDVSIIPGQIIPLNASADPGTYLWSPATGLSAANILNPVASPSITTVYTLTVTNAMGCSGSDIIKVEIKDPVADDCRIVSRNAITPNGDGINDRWIAWQGNCFDHVSVTVFNRYGTIVFQSEHYQNDWQGTFKGNPLPDGTYYTVVTYRSANGRVIEKKNDLTILR